MAHKGYTMQYLVLRARFLHLIIIQAWFEDRTPNVSSGCADRYITATNIIGLRSIGTYTQRVRIDKLKT